MFNTVMFHVSCFVIKATPPFLPTYVQVLVEEDVCSFDVPMDDCGVHKGMEVEEALRSPNRDGHPLMEGEGRRGVVCDRL